MRYLDWLFERARAEVRRKLDDGGIASAAVLPACAAEDHVFVVVHVALQEGPLRAEWEAEVRKKFPIGTRVRFLEEVDRYPDCKVPAGTTGVVTTSSELEGIGVTLDYHEPNLAEWDNQVFWYPAIMTDGGDFEAIVDDLEVLPAAEHKLHCNADRRRPLGCDMCICLRQAGPFPPNAVDFRNDRKLKMEED